MARNKFVLNATSLSKARSSWIMPKSHKTSIPFGKLVPLGKPIEILPGDTFKLDMGAVIRMLTPKAPLMDSISGDIYAYFVPNRLVFDKSKEFFGQNESQAWTLNLSYTIPSLDFTFKKSFSGSSVLLYRSVNSFYSLFAASVGGEAVSYKECMGGLSDHFELPFIHLTSAQYNSLPSSLTFKVNALPYRGYQLIWNEDFRNPSVVDPVLTFNYDHSDKTVDSPSSYSAIDALLPVMRYRDLYSSGLKAPQRGPSASLPLGSVAPLFVSDLYEPSDPTSQGGIKFDFDGLGSTSAHNLVLKSSKIQADGTTASTGETLKAMTKINLKVDLSSASAATINTLRNSIALQHLYEMMTNAFRYNEYTEVFFGVRGSDATLQRPQFLGGKHFRININQVVSTTQNSDADLGQTGAFGVGEIKGHIFTNSFTEHGLVFLFVCLRKEHTYVQGLDKLWRKRDFLDIYQPPLANLGNVDLKVSEVFFGANSSGNVDDSAFCYTEPYYEYRYEISKACGLMNPLAPGSLSFYSLTDILESKPSLNSEFVSEDPNGLDNALIASASVTDQFFGDFYLRYSVSRVMPLYSVPGLNRI